MLHRLAVGFGYRSFVYTDWASIFNLCANSATEDQYSVPLSLKISTESSSLWPKYLTSFYHLLLPLYNGEISALLLSCLFSFHSQCQKDVCLLLVFTYLKAACTNLLFFIVTADLLPRRIQGSASSWRSEFRGIWSLLDKWFLHIVPFCPLENLLLQFCFDFTLCPFRVRQDFSKIYWFPWRTVGHVSFEWCRVLCDLFFHYSEKRGERWRP